MKYNSRVRARRGIALSMCISGGLLGGAGITAAHAQDGGFADDFSVDSTQFSSGSFNGTGADFSIRPVAEGLRLETGTDNPEVPGSLFIQSTDDVDAFGIDATFLAESDVTDSATLFLEAILYSETPEPGDRNSDVEMQMTYSADGGGNYSVDYCLLRQFDDADEQSLSDFPGEFCNTLEQGTITAEERRAMDIAFDREAGTVQVSFGSTTRTITIPGEVYPATNPRQRMQLWMNFGTLGRAVANLHTLRLGEESFDLANQPLALDRYQPFFDVLGDVRTANVADGVLRMTARDDDGQEFGNALRLQNETDYLEATLTLTSESMIGSNGRVQGKLQKSLYNDRADGGDDGRTGDVHTELVAQIRANGEASVEYCLVRTEDSEGFEDRGLLEDDRYCRELPIRIAFDQPIRMAIALNREASTITYRANEIEQIETITSSTLNHSDPFAEVKVSPRSSATAVLLVDDLRTFPTALTTSESAGGATEPTPFPPVQAEPTAADSTILYPYVETGGAPLDFVDDFSQQTTLLNFDPSRNRGNYGIALINGSLRLEAAQTDPENCCGDARLRIQEDTDLVSARVSLLSESQLTVGDDTRALVRIEGSWYNDTQDNGFDSRGGDVYMQLRILQRGNGRREASFCFDRETGEGNNESLDIVDGENCGTFDTVPELDTEYDLSVQLDREAAKMTLSFADETRVVALGGPVFRAQRNERSINVQHEGTSGRAVGLVHSLTTETGTIDFATDPPLIAPYRSTYSTQSAGRAVTVPNGRLRMEVDSSLGENNQPRFVSRFPSDYVSAVLELSSESNDGGGLVNIGVGGHMYNALSDGTAENESDNTGAVYASVNLIAFDEGQRYIEYCAYQSNSPDFSDALDLISGTEDSCLRFTAPLALDTPVRTVISIDRLRGVLVFTAGEETVEYTITTGIFTPHNYFNGVRANARGGSRMVGFADDLAYSANPIALADSETRVGFVAEQATGGENGSIEPVDEGEQGSGDSSGSSSGGGGCSFASGTGGLEAPLLALIALAFLRRRSLLRLRDGAGVKRVA